VSEPRFKVGEIVWWHWSANRQLDPIKVKLIRVSTVSHQIQGLDNPAMVGPARDCELEPLSALDRLAAEL
jgi:hypothetical protein